MRDKLVLGILILFGSLPGGLAAAPTSITLAASPVQENTAARTLAGTFTVTDATQPSGHEIDLVAGQGDAHNPLFFTEGNKLRIREPLDHEQVGGTLSIRVRAADAVSAFTEQVFTVILTDNRTEDADRDGLSETAEEDQHGTSDLKPDSDHDGIGDAAEILDQTSPTNPLVFSDYPLVAWGANDAGSTAVPYGRTYAALSAGGVHATAKRYNRSVITWGGHGALGQMAVPGTLGPVASVCTGGELWRVNHAHTVAVLSDKTVVAWGNNDSGQTTIPSGLMDVVEVSAGRAHSLALRSNGSVVAWGNNQQGQCDVPPGLGAVVSVKAGGHYSLALKGDGTVAAWGKFFDGVEWIPLQVPQGLANVVEISAGWFHALALRQDGSVVAWGSNSHGQTSVPPTATGVISLAAGGFHSLALTTGGGVVAWGANQEGQSSVPPAGQLQVASVAAGGFYSLALRKSAGLPGFTSLGRIITAPGAPVEHPVRVSNATAVGFTASGLPNGLVLSPLTGVITGSVTAPVRAVARLRVTTDKGLIEQTLWISANQGQAPTQIFLNPASIVENSPGNTLIGALTSQDAGGADAHAFQLVEGAGAEHNRHFRIQDGSLRTAAAFDLDFETATLPLTVRVRATDSFLNTYEAIIAVNFIDDRSEDADGDGLSEADEEDIHLTSDLSPDSDGDGFGDSLEVMLVSEGDNSASMPEGSVLVAWGADAAAQSSVPTGLGNVVAIASGESHHLALRADGTVLGWGENNDGQAAPPGGASDLAGIAAGGFHSLGLRSDGTVTGRGRNTEGQAHAPGGLMGVVQVAAGKFHSLALKRDGSITAWGRNAEQQCDVPVGLGTAVAVAAGDDFSVALLNDGTLSSWGTGVAGTGGIISAGGELVVEVAAGGAHGLALRADGTVFGWGENGSGQIVPPPGLTDVVAIAAGSSHSMALKGDGTVVVWGNPPEVTPYDARDLDRISSGGSQFLALRREINPPDVIEEPPLEASQAMTVNHQIRASGGTPLSYAVLGLQEDLQLDPLTGVISGVVATGKLRAVRMMIKTDTGVASKVVPVNTRDGVIPEGLTLESTPVIETASASTHVGSFAVFDRDPLDAHTFELIDGTGSEDNPHFAISGNQLVVGPAGDLDFEALGDTLSIRVKASDSAGKSIDRRFTIKLLNDWSEDEDLDGLNESEEAYQVWAGSRNLQGNDALPNAQAAGGVENLIRYSFPVDDVDSTAIASVATIYEAESAELSGPVVQTRNLGFTGSGYGDFTNSSNDFIQWNIMVPVSQIYEVGFRYALATGPAAGRPLELSVNGVVAVTSQPFPVTGPSWENWITRWVNLPLVAGPNLVKLRAIGFSGGNFDHLQVRLTPLLNELRGRQGTPSVSLRREAHGDLVQIRYIRRRDAGLIFSVMHSTELEASTMQALGGVPIVIGLDRNWELVTVEQRVPTSLRRFVCLGVEFP
ncbi:MAG: hypothetical protein ACRCXD_03110 [Luteolibacter sp.]